MPAPVDQGTLASVFNQSPGRSPVIGLCRENLSQNASPPLGCSAGCPGLWRIRVGDGQFWGPLCAIGNSPARHDTKRGNKTTRHLLSLTATQVHGHHPPDGTLSSSCLVCFLLSLCRRCSPDPNGEQNQKRLNLKRKGRMKSTGCMKSKPEPQGPPQQSIKNPSKERQ